MDIGQLMVSLSLSLIILMDCGFTAAFVQLKPNINTLIWDNGVRFVFPTKYIYVYTE